MNTPTFRRLRRAVSVDTELRWGHLDDEEHDFLEGVVREAREAAAAIVDARIADFIDERPVYGEATP